MAQRQPSGEHSETLDDLFSLLGSAGAGGKPSELANISLPVSSSGEYTNAGRLDALAANAPSTTAKKTLLGSRSTSDTHLNTAATVSGANSVGGVASTPTVPASEAYPGEYAFEISFQQQPNETKAGAWVYSGRLNKLFVRISATCPISFKACGSVPTGAVIRAAPVYLMPHHVQEPVRRCPNHSGGGEFGAGALPTTHLLTSKHKLSMYHEDPVTGKHSLTLPYEKPEVGSKWTTELFQFMCFSSCMGSLNRRPIQVIFTLEQADRVLGRHSVKVRICSCPERDRRREERAASPSKPVKRNHRTALNFDDMRQRRGDDIYTVSVKGRDNFETLSRLRDALELAALVPQAQIGSYRKQQMNGWKQAPKRQQHVLQSCSTVQHATKQTQQVALCSTANKIHKLSVQGEQSSACSSSGHWNSSHQQAGGQPQAQTDYYDSLQMMGQEQAAARQQQAQSCNVLQHTAKALGPQATSYIYTANRLKTEQSTRSGSSGYQNVRPPHPERQLQAEMDYYGMSRDRQQQVQSCSAMQHATNESHQTTLCRTTKSVSRPSMNSEPSSGWSSQGYQNLSLVHKGQQHQK